MDLGMRVDKPGEDEDGRVTRVILSIEYANYPTASYVFDHTPEFQVRDFNEVVTDDCTVQVSGTLHELELRVNAAPERVIEYPDYISRVSVTIKQGSGECRYVRNITAGLVPAEGRGLWKRDVYIHDLSPEDDERTIVGYGLDQRMIRRWLARYLWQRDVDPGDLLG